PISAPRSAEPLRGRASRTRATSVIGDRCDKKPVVESVNRCRQFTASSAVISEAGEDAPLRPRRGDDSASKRRFDAIVSGKEALHGNAKVAEQFGECKLVVAVQRLRKTVFLAVDLDRFALRMDHTDNAHSGAKVFPDLRKDRAETVGGGT